jgi:DNA-binding protein H-NS
MARKLIDIQKQIAQLQKEAEALKAKELGGVVARIKEAIEHYGLTPKDLFGGVVVAATKAKAPKTAGKPRGAKKAPLIKYRDEAGNTWGGRGPRPRWFTAALAAGKSADDLLAK